MGLVVWMNENLDIAQGYIDIHRLCEEQGRIVSPNSFVLAAQQAFSIMLLQFNGTAEKARLAARKKTFWYVNKLRKKGIGIHRTGFEDPAFKDSEASQLELCNHQQGFEANAAYGFWTAETAAKTAIVLKSELAEHKLIGPGIRKLEPIIADRSVITDSGAKMADQFHALHDSISTQVVNQMNTGGRALVFPESTRSKNGDVKTFKKRIVTPPIKYIQQSDNPTLVVKTAHARGVFPHSVEEMGKWGKETPTYEMPLRFYLDLVNTSGRPPQEVLDEVRTIMRANLRTAIAADLNFLETAA